MSARPLRLSMPLAVVPSARAVDQLAGDERQLRSPVGPTGLVAELAHLSSAGTLAVRVDTGRGRLNAYTRRYVVGLYPSNQGDAYSLGFVARRTLGDEERLVRAALLLHCPRGWFAYHHVRDVPRGWSAQWGEIQRAWAEVDDAREQPAMREHHTRFLDLLTDVVDATREIEQQKERLAPPLHYRSRESAREERHSSRNVYSFRLARAATVAPGANVQLADDGELRGKVVRVRDREVVVRFDTLADHRRIPPQGGLNVLPSDVVYNAQLRTIESIREGRTANPRLLQHLVDGQLARYRPDARAQPRNGLDAAQLRVFRRALSVPDLLLVWGPPGTGKTTTITEIVAAHAERGERALLTSHANRAVDNVLERLPEHLRSVRIGNEDAMTTRARALMVDALVAGLRDQILGATADAAAGLGSLLEQGEALRRGLDYLGTRLADARTADAEAGARAVALQAIVRRISAPIRSEVAAAESLLGRARSLVERLERDLPATRLRLDRATGRAATGLLAFFWRWLAARSERRIQHIESALPAARTDLALAESGHAAVQERVRALVAGDPEAALQERAQQAAAARREEALHDAALVADGVVAGLRAAGLTPPTWPSRIAEWAPFQEWLAWAVSTAGRRASLLLEWRGQVEEAEEDLQRELIRYADVVAATCIGSATSKALQEVEFDLVIVDEAGQVSLPTLLVPLVKARRAILVGDHKQLPPFLDEDVKQWSERVDHASETTPETARWIADVVRKSAFEQLHGFADDDHRDVLTVQRRMPEVIADFVSKEFYGGLLQTEHRQGAADPLFRSRFALVDTSDRPPDERREQQVGRLEESGQRGYVNDLEARLIASLVVQYVRWYENWAVIVPYRAQADRIRRLLQHALGSEPSIPESVNTVDSFQGGERELVVYGFTRSNDRGAVGFLRELRRINVAITRAKRQLVLVGDTRTLIAARDDGFARLMRSLAAHVAQRGDACSSRDVERRLAVLAERRP